MDENSRQRNQDRLESTIADNSDQFDLFRDGDYFVQPEYTVQPAPSYQPYPDQSYLMRSFFFNQHVENKEPIPQPQDYQPEPFYSSEILGGGFKGYQPDSGQATGWPLMFSLSRREDFRQAVVSTAPSLQEAPGVKLEPEQSLKEQEAVPEPIADAPQGEQRLLGGLTSSQRREKINLYLEKRRRRSFAKKVAYDCRKKVADQRIRVKGRFVTRTQALKLLDLAEGDYPEETIKQMLMERLPRKSSSPGSDN